METERSEGFSRRSCARDPSASAPLAARRLRQAAPIGRPAQAVWCLGAALEKSRRAVSARSEATPRSQGDFAAGIASNLAAASPCPARLQPCRSRWWRGIAPRPLAPRHRAENWNELKLCGDMVHVLGSRPCCDVEHAGWCRKVLRKLPEALNPPLRRR